MKSNSLLKNKYQLKSKYLLMWGGLLGMISVILGAYAAHGLTSILNAQMVDVFKTGVLYQFFHTFAIIACALLIKLTTSPKTQKYFFIAAICFIIGIFCFSGSLYALTLTGSKWFGPVTPLGGLLFIIGWALFAYAAFTIKEVS